MLSLGNTWRRDYADVKSAGLPVLRLDGRANATPDQAAASIHYLMACSHSWD
jgi:hypothetical protein